jgi:HSP20 family protein
MAREPKTWTPIHELDRFRRDFDDLFDRFLGGRGSHHETEANVMPALESYLEKGNLVIRIDLPGIDPKNVEIIAAGDHLTIRGKRERAQEEQGKDFFHREVCYGSFERTVRMPAGVNAEAVKASYKNGVLELTVQVPEQARSRKVPIEVADKS